MTGLALWHRIALPAPGGVGDQDAWLLAALDHLCAVHNDIVYADYKRRRPKLPKKRTDRGQ